MDAIRLEDNRHLPEDELKKLMTIDEIFTRLQQAQADFSIDSVSVEFDTKLGYPANLFIDPNAVAVDDEKGYRISSVEEL